MHNTPAQVYVLAMSLIIYIGYVLGPAKTQRCSINQGSEYSECNVTNSLNNNFFVNYTGFVVIWSLNQN